jgi:hypothetical protein
MRNDQNDGIIRDLPENVVGIISSETVTEEDYDNVLIPAIKGKLKKYEKIRILYQTSRDFSHLTYDAHLEDAKVPWHITSIEKIAVVSVSTGEMIQLKYLSLLFLLR